MQQARVVAEATARGAEPASLRRELGSLRESQLDWRSYLWRFLVQTPTDFTGFDRRFIGQRLYLETLAGESVRVHVAVDTSGSVDKAQLNRFLSEVQAIVMAYPQLQCDLYFVDSAVHGPFPLTGQSMPTPVGGGGTDFRPFFKQISDQQDPWTASVSVYLTDGYGRFPMEAPSQPVLWVVTPGGLASDRFPFGDVIRLVPG
jgi:predicted metal-dependent peptidase